MKTVKQFLEAEKELDKKMLVLIKEERFRAADIIEAYRETYEKITKRPFESARVDDVNSCNFENWYRYPAKKEDNIYTSEEKGSWMFRGLLGGVRCNCSYDTKIGHRILTVKDLLNWLRSTPKLLTRPTLNIC